MTDVVMHDTYFVWGWGSGVIYALMVIALILSIAALLKYLLFR
jgi:hypothetical protein